ncbi:MAG: hypothetical protein Q9224_006978, partial [Gallowayella concinna]
FKKRKVQEAKQKELLNKHMKNMTADDKKLMKYKLNRKNCKCKYTIDSNDSDSEKENTMKKMTQKYLEPVFCKYEIVQYGSTLV